MKRGRDYWYNLAAIISACGVGILTLVTRDSSVAEQAGGWFVAAFWAYIVLRDSKKEIPTWSVPYTMSDLTLAMKIRDCLIKDDQTYLARDWVFYGDKRSFNFAAGYVSSALDLTVSQDNPEADHVAHEAALDTALRSIAPSLIKQLSGQCSGNCPVTHCSKPAYPYGINGFDGYVDTCFHHAQDALIDAIHSTPGEGE